MVSTIRADLLQLLHAGWTWLPFVCIAFVFQLIAVAIVYMLFLGAGSAIGLPEVALIAAVHGLAGLCRWPSTGSVSPKGRSLWREWRWARTTKMRAVAADSAPGGGATVELRLWSARLA